jgi:DNA ligase 1
MASDLPEGTVLDGEILAFKDGNPTPLFYATEKNWQKEFKQQNPERCPVSFIAYDILEKENKDIRNMALSSRRDHLEQIISVTKDINLIISPKVIANNWQEIQELRLDSRKVMAEGFMLKRKDSSYEVGRKRGNWWKWKIDPLTIDGVMVYAQKGHGRRADLYTDYTFAVWDSGKLVPFAKAYSGLTDAEIREVDKYVKKNTLKDSGP